MTNKLKECPFCGGEASVYNGTGVWHDSVFVACDDCGAEISTYDTEEEAIEAWNRRVEDDSIPR